MKPKKTRTLFSSHLLLFPAPLPHPDLLALDVLFPIVCICPPPLPNTCYLRCYALEMDITCDVVRIRRVISKPNFGRRGKTLIERERNLRLQYEQQASVQALQGKDSVSIRQRELFSARNECCELCNRERCTIHLGLQSPAGGPYEKSNTLTEFPL